MLLFVLLSNFYGNKVQDIQIENYPTKIFLKKTEILFAFSNKDVPLHPVNKAYCRYSSVGRATHS